MKTNRSWTWHRDNCPCKGRPQATTARLAGRIASFDQREAEARQTTGGAKIVPMMTKPGSQNRNK